MECELQCSPQRAMELSRALSKVLKEITQAAQIQQRQVRLVAVSKLKPASDIATLHARGKGQVDFGENYAQELREKAKVLPLTIKWHFIGSLQTNKCRPLAESITNLWCVSSVDSIRKATALDKGRATLLVKLYRLGLLSPNHLAGNDIVNLSQSTPNEESLGYAPKATNNPDITSHGIPDWFEVPLRVMIQVNTSGEVSKSGCSPDEALELCRYVCHECSYLRLHGLMMIGTRYSTDGLSDTENPEFNTLRDLRDRITQAMNLPETNTLELSMGMSADYHTAISQGSTEVRIGSTIFGDRLSTV